MHMHIATFVKIITIVVETTDVHKFLSCNECELMSLCHGLSSTFSFFVYLCLQFSISQGMRFIKIFHHKSILHKKLGRVVCTLGISGSQINLFSSK
jgi:hypothetical protein